MLLDAGIDVLMTPHRSDKGHREGPVFSRRSSIGIYAVTATSSLRAHAAQNDNDRVGLSNVVRRSRHEGPLSGNGRNFAKVTICA
jgi:hypothetical protein